MAKEEDESQNGEVKDDDDAVETSLEEFLQRKERRGGTRAEDAEEEEAALLEAMDEREGRGSESLSVKVVPEQENEFTCRGCFLVKHHSQLKNAKKVLCNDCA